MQHNPDKSAEITVAKIISGGQTGVDMAALEFARNTTLAYGGWVPKGRTNEAGVIPAHLEGLRETNTADVAERTRLNVSCSDATLVLTEAAVSPGTQKTIDFAREAGKPFLVVDLRNRPDQNANTIMHWLCLQKVKVLNVAGPRASEAPGIGSSARHLLELVFSDLCS